MLPHRLVFSIAFSTWLTLVCGLSLTGMLIVAIHGFEQEKEDFNFERRAGFAVTAINDGLNEVVQALRVVNQSFATFAPVSRAQFHDFTQPLLKRYPYIRAISFHRIASHAERLRLEAEMRQIDPHFAVTEMVDGKRIPARNKDSYRIVEYIEPLAGNEAAFGLDATSRSYQNAALKRALETGLPAATELQRLITEESSESQGFLILMPVYRKGVPLDSSRARREAAIGYTVVVLRTWEFIESILRMVEPAVVPFSGISIYASSAPSEPHLAFRRGEAPQNGTEVPVWLRRWWHDDPPDFSKTLDVAGIPWHMAVSPPRIPFVQGHLGCLLAGVIGALFSIFAAGYMQSLSSRTRRVERLVGERTAELNQANELLIEDISAREKVEEALQESRNLLRRLAAHQESIREDERKRIAREIHDDLGQNLLALRIDMSMLQVNTGALTQVNEKVSAALIQIDRTMKAVRGIINNLRPAVLDLGLHAAIEWQAKEFERRSGISCDVKIDHDEFGLDDGRATTLFRIVQESLTNVQRHAQATSVRIALRKQNGRLFMDIADNGVGFAPERRRAGNRFGLMGIEERIKALDGTFSVGSDSGQGMLLAISVPIGAEASAKREIAQQA